MRKRIFSLSLVFVLLTVLCSCGSSYQVYTIPDENNAIIVYELPVENMYGLEKVAFYEKKIVSVFDIEANARGGYINLDLIELDTICFPIKNSINAVPGNGTLEKIDGKYVLTAYFLDDNTDSANNPNPYGFTFFCEGKTYEISRMDSDIKLSFTYPRESDSSIVTFSQCFDTNENKWSGVLLDSPQPYPLYTG